MNILLAAATEFEIAAFKNNNIGSTDFLISGVGVPNTLYHIQNALNKKLFDLVIQAGIAGAFTNEFELGETILVKQDTFADIGIIENEIFTPIYNTELFNKNEYPFINGWLNNNHPYLKKSNLELVKAITVNTVTDNKSTIEQQIKLFNPEIESMEGAALHFVCLQQNIPFIQIRSISNYVGERDKLKWKMEEAINNLNVELTNLINDLTILPIN